MPPSGCFCPFIISVSFCLQILFGDSPFFERIANRGVYSEVMKMNRCKICGQHRSLIAGTCLLCDKIYGDIQVDIAAELQEMHD